MNQQHCHSAFSERDAKLRARWRGACPAGAVTPKPVSLSYWLALAQTQVLAYMSGKRVVDLCVTRNWLFQACLWIEVDVVPRTWAYEHAAVPPQFAHKLAPLHMAMAF